MRYPWGVRVRRLFKNRAALMVVLAVLLILGSGGMALGSGTPDAGHGGDATAVHGEPAVHGEAAGHAEGEQHGKGWVATDTYRVMNFAVLAIALFFLLRKPFSNALNSRIQGIKDQLADLENKKVRAQQELAGYDKKLADLSQEAEKIVAEYVRQGEDAKLRILKEAESAAEKLETQAKRNIAHEFAQAKSQLQAEIIEKALAKAEGILASQITTEDQDRLVDEYLEKVVA
ncbi:ATP synthase F0 subunit B [Desulfonema ishimotonii]|uniref:ATP synthase subunit b n=1 Tax=Desulfonema ishimotonii TaxID=45657 RepID=A0A401G4B4_9BACT|nr:ATP synthase F0 subunit B [Desulfonema ishimotonii]GBC64078.1 ATP synthase F0 subunit B [Desulfonema ishimotonii]